MEKYLLKSHLPLTPRSSFSTRFSCNALPQKFLLFIKEKMMARMTDEEADALDDSLTG
ncbi:MAG: hypothetical protein LBG94_05450 [Treponema sp.]|jgi:hypothetical protein|nr:hypothetical protein [Treponema sp.]